MEKGLVSGFGKKNWFCHATRNYRQFCNRMCLLLTGTWRRRDQLVDVFVFVVLFGLHGCCICFARLYGDSMDDDDDDDDDDDKDVLRFVMILHGGDIYIYIQRYMCI